MTCLHGYEKVLVDIKILEQVLRTGIKQFTLSTFPNSLHNKIENVEAWKAWNTSNEISTLSMRSTNSTFSSRPV